MDNELARYYVYDPVNDIYHAPDPAPYGFGVWAWVKVTTFNILVISAIVLVAVALITSAAYSQWALFAVQLVGCFFVCGYGLIHSEGY